MKNKQISFNFPSLKASLQKEAQEESVRNKRKIRSDYGLVTCVWCGEKVGEAKEIFLFERRDNHSKEHHIGYVFSKENMKLDKLFSKYVGKANICGDCEENQ